jgi:multiple sugar transport system ATP-binding protein
MSTLTFDHVTKRFGKVVAVNDFSITVEDGEFLVLLGPSGCGKTTAMRMVAGLEDVTAGSIFIDEDDITFLPPRKRNVSMIFQNYAVWPHMTVFENIAYPLRLKKVPKEEIDKKVNDVAGMVKIGELLKRYPAQLSGGQQQRVAVARALAVEPKIFLMDEPLSNLDAKLRGSMRTELKAIHAKTGATSVFVTHDQSEAMSMADRIVVMREGQIIQVGSPDDVYDRSASVFVADFIGTPPTNFLDVEKKVSNGTCQLINPHFELTLKKGCDQHVLKYSKRELLLGVRPENIVVVPEEDALFSSECLVSEPQGSHQIIAVELDDKFIKIVAPAQPKINPGDIVHLNFKQETLRFFDPETELSIDHPSDDQT